MSRIEVEPEGREGVWLADRDSLKRWIEARGWDMVHNFMPSSQMMIGADWSTSRLLRAVAAADRVAVLTGDARRQNLNHALALILPADDVLPERLAMFDIGEVSEADLHIVVEPAS